VEYVVDLFCQYTPMKDPLVRALILYRHRRFINHLLTYLLNSISWPLAISNKNVKKMQTKVCLHFQCRKAWLFTHLPDLFIRPSMRQFVLQLPVLTTNEPILMPISTSGQHGKDTKRLTLGVRRSNVTVTQGQPGRGIILNHLGPIVFCFHIHLGRKRNATSISVFR